MDKENYDSIKIFLKDGNQSSFENITNMKIIDVNDPILAFIENTDNEIVQRCFMLREISKIYTFKKKNENENQKEN